MTLTVSLPRYQLMETVLVIFSTDVNMKPSGAPTGVVTSLLLTKVISTNTPDGNDRHQSV